MVRHIHLQIASPRRASDVSDDVLKVTYYTSSQGASPATLMDFALLRKGVELVQQEADRIIDDQPGKPNFVLPL